MAKRGRKPKEELVVAIPQVDHAKLLKQYKEEQKVQLEHLYKDLAKVKYQVDRALTHVGLMDNCETIGEAAFKAGRAFGPLDEANDRLEEILNDMFDNNDLDHWDDVIEEN